MVANGTGTFWRGCQRGAVLARLPTANGWVASFAKRGQFLDDLLHGVGWNCHLQGGTVIIDDRDVTRVACLIHRRTSSCGGAGRSTCGIRLEHTTLIPALMLDEAMHTTGSLTVMRFECGKVTKRPNPREQVRSMQSVG